MLKLSVNSQTLNVFCKKGIYKIMVPLREINTKIHIFYKVPSSVRNFIGNENHNGFLDTMIRKYI